MSLIESLREEFLTQICSTVIYLKKGTIPGMADVASPLSIEISRALIEQLARPICPKVVKGQTAGKRLEMAAKNFLEQAFAHLQHIRPGRWRFSTQGKIAAFEQYQHLAQLSRLVDENPQLRTALGDYIIKPDIIVARYPVPDEQINQDSSAPLVRPNGPPSLSPLRAVNESRLTLHASISCKWTIRSDRSQNARTEGLNLIRNRKGHTPHIAVITGEPLPGRIASLAMGTGDIDCVYHFALPELATAVDSAGDQTSIMLLGDMIHGRRLRDIADLPFDLAI
jgi:hypothetical protein